MNEYLYSTKQMLTDFHEQYVKETRRYPKIRETLRLMKERGLLSETPLPVPEVDGQMSVAQFRHAYEQIPFEASRIIELEEEERIVSERSIFPDNRDVFCVQHFHNFIGDSVQIDAFFTVTYVFDGACSFQFGEDLIDLKTGDICIIAPYSRYSMQPFSNTFAYEAIIRSSSFNLMFNELLTANSDLSEFFRNALLQKNYENYFIIKAETIDDELRMYLQAFTAECINDDIYANTCAVSLMKLFLTRAFRKYGHMTAVYKKDYHLVRLEANSILKYIQNNYRNATLAQTAEFFHYNRTYFSRFIHAHFHKSFIEIVTELKISHAKEYLKNSNRRIADIAQLVGYDSADHFSRTFKKYTGISPAQYRAKHMG